MAIDSNRLVFSWEAEQGVGIEGYGGRWVGAFSICAGWSAGRTTIPPSIPAPQLETASEKSRAGALNTLFERHDLGGWMHLAKRHSRHQPFISWRMCT